MPGRRASISTPRAATAPFAAWRAREGLPGDAELITDEHGKVLSDALGEVHDREVPLAQPRGAAVARHRGDSEKNQAYARPAAQRRPQRSCALVSRRA